MKWSKTTDKNFVNISEILPLRTTSCEYNALYIRTISPYISTKRYSQSESNARKTESFVSVVFIDSMNYSNPGARTPWNLQLLTRRDRLPVPLHAITDVCWRLGSRKFRRVWATNNKGKISNETLVKKRAFAHSRATKRSRGAWIQERRDT